MNKENFWKLATFFLLGLNLALLAFWFFSPGRPGKGRPPRPDHLIIHGLALTPEQIDQFEQLKQNHFSAIQQINVQELSTKKQLFKAIAASTYDSLTINECLLKLAEYKKQKDQVTLAHFQDLRNLCDSSQREKFSEVMEQVAEILMHSPKSGPPAPSHHR